MKFTDPVLFPIPKNTSVIVTQKPEYKQPLPAYDCIGGNVYFETNEPGYPKLYKTLGSLSKKANEMFWAIVEVKDYKNNIGILKANNQTERNKLSAAYKELRKLDLLRRVKQNHYMVNPKVILPLKHYPECKDKYFQLK